MLYFFYNISIRKYCQNIDDWTQANEYTVIERPYLDTSFFFYGVTY